ncbi:MAG: DUF2344 domain-containing protein [Synergistaceae bacterium]|nr:DUF2344 domain-containing protein [Synergistaceae bacterium]
MSVRVRLIYEKRGGACFVPHVALASLFTRAALRAGLSLTLTQGFSPHPKMSFGPELPAGVVALNEPVDIWMEDAPGDFLERWDAAMPEGFRLISASFPDEGSPKLGTVCQAALYWVRCGSFDSETLLEKARGYYGEAVLAAEAGLDIEENGKNEWLSLTLSDPAQNAIGGWVRALIAEGAVSGWQDVNIVRAAIGSGSGCRMI